MSGRRLQVVVAMDPGVQRRIFSAPSLARLDEIADLRAFITEFDSDAARGALAEADVLITGWMSPYIDGTVLEAAPRLRAILHSGGTIKPFVSDDVLAQGIKVSSAAAANATPVAEYTVAMILLANKKVLPIAARYRALRQEPDVEAEFPGLGNFDRRVGIVGASKIGQKVIELLGPYDLELVVYDPYLTAAEARRLGVERVELDDLLATSDVVSVHAPSLPSTRNLIDADGIASMRAGATLVNTARGEIVDQVALTDRVVAGELFAVLDVTTPWVLEHDHPLYVSDHALLTPHIAGSLGVELHRLADVVIDELRRLAIGHPLEHEVEADRMSITA
jgi:phosphoglycerate dehydrogenase-like enzyme